MHSVYDYGYYMFVGGPYRKQEVLELVDDLGGIVVQELTMGLDLVMFIAIPRSDIDALLKLASELKAKVSEAKLIGSEIAVVPPSMSYRHLPHPACDINEYLRRYGSKTFMVGLSRGVGQKRALLTSFESRFLNEVDAAVFIMGNVGECIKRKAGLVKALKVPVVIVGGPQRVDLPPEVTYIGGLGRIAHRLKSSNELKALSELVESLGVLLERRRKELSEDPPLFPPALLKKELEEQVEDAREVTVLKIDGVRVQLKYDDYAKIIGNVVIEGHKLGEVASLERSVLEDNIIVRLLPESMLS
ncbi:MAG: methyl-coenzyme M reductase family protein [Candidatus Nezhaarchaeota archaeon]|nr:methyl-coenzyme M reductase family protein [Candidatus Nezhaarchaeota archaeon]